MAKEASKPAGQRAISLTAYLQRFLPYWGHPGWLEAARWRQLVRNQPIAIICRETLTENLLSMDWSINPKKSDDDSQETKDDIEWYTDMFMKLEDDFDNYLELICQDMLDLPFGAAVEVFREPDEEDGKVVWAEHIDAATLYPTLDYEYPVLQKVPEIISKTVTFPRHAIERMYMTPRPEIKRKGWGMAPPEKIYLAMEMLFRGDKYYANLLLDTPEAGILDLVDMQKESAEDWLSSMKELFQGIDGMKVPVLYEHKTPAQWIPLNRPPIDMLYDKTTLKYAQITAAGYGMRLSDIGMSEVGGEKTLAGVIRGERQTKRSGFALVRSKTENHFNALLPDNLKWTWEDTDEESQMARGRALQTVGMALTQLTSGEQPILSGEEARQELVATGLLSIEIDPKKMPEPPEEEGQPFPFGSPQQGGPMAGPPQGKNGGGKPQDQGGKLPSQGGRGGGFLTRALGGLIRRDRVSDQAVDEAVAPQHMEPEAMTPERLIAEFDMVVGPGLRMIPERAEPIRLRRLIKAATKVMFPSVQRAFVALSDAQIEEYWLPEMNSIEFDLPSELESVVIRQSQEEVREAIERHLDDDPWWRVASAWEKQEIIEVMIRAYEFGMQEQALNILRALYEEGFVSSPFFSPELSFTLVDVNALAQIERSAAQFVTHVDQGTKYFLKRIISAGVRKGLANPKIAAAIREGARADALLRDDGFMQETINEIRVGMIEMSETRANSIVQFEVRRAASAGQLKQQVESGLKTKAWVHMGSRGVTDKGNPHPCPVCTENEDLGFVGNDYQFKSVFKKKADQEPAATDEKKAGILHPPAHPNVCHCRLIFDEKELFEIVGKGEYTPFTGEDLRGRIMEGL